MRKRHTPQRTCVECRTTRSKRELVRIVRLAEGGVTVDETGKKSGRGAYLCRRRTCWDRALSCGRMGYALKTTLTAEENEALRAFAGSLPEVEESEDMQAIAGTSAGQGG